ncbi:pPIWI_RE_Y domain-containing protein [Streptomyces niveus]
MNEWITGPRDDASERRRRVVAAALRAAYAWSVRRRFPLAMREVAMMTGVVMEVHGPGRGPASPAALIDCLRAPLGELPVFAGSSDDEDSAIADAVLLDRHDRMTPEVDDLICEYALPLAGTFAAEAWLPTWTRMHADHIRQQAFASLIETRSQEDYVASRKFLIDHPAGSREELAELVSTMGVRVVFRGYTEIPAERRYHVNPDTQWWWPCPVCAWPMSVAGRTVRCRYRPHTSVFRIVSGKTSLSRPGLTAVDEGPRAARPEARPVRDAVCLDAGVWRFVVVPGASELRLCRALEEQGAEVRLWPELDSYDLYVLAGEDTFRIDVKEYRSVHRLIADLRAKPPQARVLLPRTHEHQLDAVKAALPSLDMTTETRFRAQVRRALKKEGRTS